MYNWGHFLGILFELHALFYKIVRTSMGICELAEVVIETDWAIFYIWLIQVGKVGLNLGTLV